MSSDILEQNWIVPSHQWMNRVKDGLQYLNEVQLNEWLNRANVLFLSVDDTPKSMKSSLN